MRNNGVVFIGRRSIGPCVSIDADSHERELWRAGKCGLGDGVTHNGDWGRRRSSGNSGEGLFLIRREDAVASRDEIAADGGPAPVSGVYHDSENLGICNAVVLKIDMCSRPGSIGEFNARTGLSRQHITN